MVSRKRGSRPRWPVAGLLAALLIMLGVSAWSLRASAALPAPAAPAAAAPPAAPAAQAADPALQKGIIGPVVIHEEKHDISPPLRDLVSVSPRAASTEHEIQRHRAWTFGNDADVDAVVQRVLGLPLIPAPTANFDGINFLTGGCNCAPPDTNADVGPNHVVETVNSSYAVYNKTGTQLQAPRDVNTLWSGFGGACETRNDGDPIVKYDQMADRWLINQFTSAPPFYQCVAVSTSPDPIGAYARYAFLESNTVFGDYQKIAVWPDGYYMSTNEFNAAGTVWLGAGNYSMDRSRMLAGLSATMLYFHLPASDWGGQQPSDFDGSIPPPAGAPNLFVEIDDSAWDPPNIPTDQILMWKFHSDFVTPGNSTFTALPPIVPPQLAAFDGLLCNFASCVPQPGTIDKLDTLADRVMYRVAYRNFGDHEAVVFNHTVDVGTNVAGVRWYELRNISATPTIFQQGTYAPNSPTDHHWMASIAMDRAGNMGLGYAISNASTTFPSVRYTGRLVTDPAGQMPQGEGVFVNGTGSQLQTNGRWGDYSSLVVDPTDDCTFWYAQEYYQVTGAYSWSTRIGSFKFPSCGAVTPTVVPSATRTAAPTQTPGGATATPEPCQIQYTDVPPSNPFYTYVHCLACRGIVSGYSTSPPCTTGTPCYQPASNVTRGQMAKFVANAAGYADAIPSSQQTFTDVPYSSPFWIYVERAYLHGVISGYTSSPPCTTGVPCFLPSGNVTRGQTAKFVSNAVPYNDPIPSTQQTFTDVPNSSPFWVFVERAYAHGLISGYTSSPPCTTGVPCFQPSSNVTRGQTSKFIANGFFPNCVTPQR
ncbi:MAG TPA: S-layer homology domain-containing protein [Chloroflexia bacterium]|nr:S-layer homology domain-containing protein [Chloroflexia bacterium]